jgi:acetoacetate decarboxylase
MPTKQRRGSLERLKENTFDFAVNINYKILPQIDGRTAVRQLTSRLLADVDVTECWEGPCTVELRPNAQAPVFRLPVRSLGEGYHWKGNFSLKTGEILHEYGS